MTQDLIKLCYLISQLKGFKFIPELNLYQGLKG